MGLHGQMVMFIEAGLYEEYHTKLALLALSHDHCRLPRTIRHAPTDQNGRRGNLDLFI